MSDSGSEHGAPTKAKAMASLLADLGINDSHGRPHASNDNLFSESHFETLEYQPALRLH